MRKQRLPCGIFLQFVVWNLFPGNRSIQGLCVTGIKSVELSPKMSDGSYRVMDDHSLSCVFHDRLHLPPQLRLVAMDGTQPTGLFLFLKSNSGQSLLRIFHQLPERYTYLPDAIHFAAIEAYHQLYGFLFFLYA